MNAPLPIRHQKLPAAELLLMLACCHRTDVRMPANSVSAGGRGKCTWGAACKYAHDPRLIEGNPTAGLGPRVAQPHAFAVPAVSPGFMPQHNPALMAHHPQMVPLHPAHIAAAQHQQQLLMQQHQLMQQQFRLPAPGALRCERD